MTSRTARHALRAVVYLAVLNPDAPVPAGRIAEALGAPANYLSKILNTLTAQGFLESTPGRRGGFRLARPPEIIHLSSVLDVFDAPAETVRCLIGARSCGELEPCVVHDAWGRVRRACREPLERTTVGDLLAAGRSRVREGA